MIVLRGAIDELILDATAPMKKGDSASSPATMVHGGEGRRLRDATSSTSSFRRGRIIWPRKRRAKPRSRPSFRPTPRSSSFVDGAKSGPGPDLHRRAEMARRQALSLEHVFRPEMERRSQAKRHGRESIRTGHIAAIIHEGCRPTASCRCPTGTWPSATCSATASIEMTTKGRIVRTSGLDIRGQADRRPQRPCRGRQGRDLFHRPAIHAGGQKISARPGGLLYHARGQAHPGHPAQRIRHAQRHPPQPRRQDSLRQQHL